LSSKRAVPLQSLLFHVIAGSARSLGDAGNLTRGRADSS
jgi:hypothetical protein